MGLLDFIKPKRRVSSVIDEYMDKMWLTAVPGGAKQIDEESAQLRTLIPGRLSEYDAHHLTALIRLILVHSKDESEEKIIQRILDGATAANLRPHEAKRAYQFLSGISTK